MPDIQLRFHKDMLVLTGPLDTAMARMGLPLDADGELLLMTEPELLLEAMRLEVAAGAQCLVTPTDGITRARLAHRNLEDDAPELAQAALRLAAQLSPQHTVAQIGPTRLPIDPTSKASLSANRDDYAQAARAFGEEGLDALFLDGLTSTEDVLCGCMGVRMATAKPLIVSVPVAADGTIPGRAQTIEEACATMQEYEADVAGFCTAAPIEEACAIASRMAKACDLPILAQLVVPEHDDAPHFGVPRPAAPYETPDEMMDAALALRGAGVQFLQAKGAATPAYTGAMAAAVSGLDAVR